MVYPALSAVRRNLADDLKTGSRTVTSVGTAFRSGLVVAQVAVSVVLLIGSALLIRSLSLVSAVDPGFVVQRTSSLPRSSCHGVTTRTARLESSSSAGSSSRLEPSRESRPPGSSTTCRSEAPRNVFGVHTPEEPESSPSAYLRSVMPGYFDTMRIPLLMGREIDDRDTEGTLPVAVINEQAAERFLRGQNAAGRTTSVRFLRRDGNRGGRRRRRRRTDERIGYHSSSSLCTCRTASSPGVHDAGRRPLS